MSRAGKGGVLAVVSAVLSAIASSACCWLPLTLLAFGMSAGGVAAWFEQYRKPFLIGSVVFLAIGFYLVYAHSPTCEPGSACATRDKRLARISKAGLWVSAVVILMFALFPKYIGTFLPQTPSTTADLSGAKQVRISIQNMICEACAVTLREDLRKVPGVIDADISYTNAKAVLHTEESAFQIEQAINAISKAGYIGTQNSTD